MNMKMPADGFILLSYVNTKLRDCYSSLDEFCEAEDVGREALTERLSALGYEYDDKRNAFVSF